MRQPHLIFLSTDDLLLLHNRIQERMLRGDHYVRPDIVEERYFVGLKLLNHYFKLPDVVQLIDNSKALKAIAIKNDNIYSLFTPTPPEWFTKYLSHHFNTTEKAVPIKDLLNIEEVKKQYQQLKGKTTNRKT